MPEEARDNIPRGFVLSDSNEKKWIIGSFIGIDGSAENYEAAEYHEGEKTEYYPELIKLKPHGDKTLSSEINFFKLHANPQAIAKWIEPTDIHYEYLGLPYYLGSAQNVKIADTNVDFLVLARYGPCLETVLVEHNNLFPKPTVLKIAYHILGVLEYLHQRGIVHGNIRACNIRMDYYGERIVYLLPQFHAVGESDRNAMMFWSEYQHCGATTKRGDFESLLFNLIDWSGGILPWKDASPDEMKDMKSKAFENPNQFLGKAFPTCECEDSLECLAARKCTASGKVVAASECLQAITDLMEQVASMDKTKRCQPDYRVIEKILRKRLLNMYHVPTSRLQFSMPTFISDKDSDEKSSRRERKSFDKYIPGLRIAVDTLTHILAENCLSFDEVDTLNNKYYGVVDVILEMKKTNRIVYDEKPDRIREAWDLNSQNLRTKVIKQWQLKGIEPGSYDDWKQAKDKEKRPTSAAPMGDRKKAALQNRSEPVATKNTGSNSRSVEQDSNLDSDSDNLTLLQSKPHVEEIPSKVTKTLAPESNEAPDGSDELFSEETVPETTEVADSTSQQAIKESLTSVDRDSWFSTYKRLDAWLRLREKLLKVFGPISSDPQAMTDQLQELRELRDEYGKQELLDRLSLLANVLTGLSPDSADAKKLNGIQQRWLKQLVWLDETSRKLGDASLSQVHDVLQDSEILAWLLKELDGMPEKLTISTDPVKFQKHREHYQMVYQRVIDNEPKVVKLINDGHDVLMRSQNLKSKTAQQLFLDVMQCQWDHLKKSSLNIYNKLQNIDKYWQIQSSFLDWLSKTEGKLEILKPLSSNNIEQVLKELSSSTNESREKADEIAQMTELRHVFIGVCDEDKNDQVKDDFNAVKDRWTKLNTDLLKRTQSFVSGIVVSFNKILHNLQQKIELCVAVLASYGASSDSAFSDCTKELRKEIVLLQRSCDIVCQEAKNLLSKTHEESIGASHLLNEMNRVTIRVKSLNFNVSESTIKILKQQCVILTTELDQAENYNKTILDIIEKKRTLTSKIKRSFNNITDLGKNIQAVKELEFTIDTAAMWQQVESLSQHINKLKTQENGLQEALKNGSDSSNIDELAQKLKEKPSEVEGDGSSDSNSSNDVNWKSKSTESSKNKRQQACTTLDSSPNEISNEFSSSRRRSQSQDSNFDPSRPSTSNDNLQSHTDSIYDEFGSKSITSSKSSKTQNMSNSDLSPSRPKKSKHSKDLNVKY